jgi:tetratricopeptide (TPR) repeat protein
MKSSEELFLLVKSLTKSEKRYILVHASKQQKKGRENNSIQLLRVLQKQKSYDEKKIQLELRNKVSARNFSWEKNRLYNLILQILKQFHANSSLKMEVDDMFHFATILFKKGLYQQSHKAILKAIKLTHIDEQFLEILYISALRIKVTELSAQSSTEMQQEMQHSLSNIEDALQKLTNLSEYYKLHIRVFLLIRKEGEAVRNQAQLQECNSIMKHELMSRESRALTNKAKELYHFIRETCLYLKGEVQEVYRFEMKDLERELAKRKHPWSSSYMSKIANLCETCLRMKNYETCKDLLLKLEGLKPKSMLEQSQKFYRHTDLFLRLSVHTGRFENAAKAARGLETELERYGVYIHKSKLISIHYYLAYVYLGVGDLKNALKSINKTMLVKTDLRMDLQCFARLLNFIIHFELGNTDQLEHLFKSAYTFFVNKDKLYKFERIAMKLLRKLSKVPGDKEMKQVFLEIKTDLARISKDPFEKPAFEYFDLISWLESRIEGKDLGELIRNIRA